MAKQPKLKVYRTAIGFEDAYVAAASQKAALAAWATSKDLFARGFAELVTKASLTKAPLAQPSKVVRIARGTLAQHLSARRSKTQAASNTPPQDCAPAKRKPRPSRAALDRAEAGFEADTEKFRIEAVKIERAIEKLRADQDSLAARREATLGQLKERCDDIASRYREALADWSRSSGE